MFVLFWIPYVSLNLHFIQFLFIKMCFYNEVLLLLLADVIPLVRTFFYSLLFTHKVTEFCSWFYAIDFPHYNPTGARTLRRESGHFRRKKWDTKNATCWPRKLTMTCCCWCDCKDVYFCRAGIFQRWTSTHKEKTHPYHILLLLHYWGWGATNILCWRGGAQ